MPDQPKAETTDHLTCKICHVYPCVCPDDRQDAHCVAFLRGIADRSRQHKTALMTMPETTVKPVDVVGASGPVNGLHEPDAGGAYILITGVYRDGSRHVFKISKGSAEILAAEIAGCLHGW